MGAATVSIFSSRCLDAGGGRCRW